MKLTACITTFNRPEFLRESLNSLCNQTNGDFEILILDNGSDIVTENIINNYKKYYKNILYKRHKPISISEQRNLALNLVNTKYLGFLDDDDYWHEKKVQEFFNFLEEINQKEIALWYSGFKFFKDNDSKRIFSNTITDAKSDLRSLLMQRGDFTGSASNPIINVKIAKEISGFDNKILTGEDYDFYLRLSKKNKFYFSYKSLTFIRQHQGSRLGGRLRDYIRTEINILRKFYGLYPEIDQILLRKIVTKLIRINKSKSARNLLNLKKIHFNREYLLNFLIYIASFLGINFYSFFHKTFLNWSKRLRR
tara:strand:+ start:6872 stop:7795 length:924 start_codon:yes stop_codon:yes gene_type:complete